MEERFRYLWQNKETEKKPFDSDAIRDEISKREKAAFEKGYEQARQEIEKELSTEEDTYSLLLQNMNDNISKLMSSKKDEFEQSLYKLAIAIGEKLSSTILEERHLETVTGFINEIVSKIKDQPAITIKVNDKLVETLQKELHEYSIVGDMQLASSDCIITWDQGAAFNILKDKKADIEEIVLKKYEVNDDR